MFQRCKSFLVCIGFLVHGDMTACDSADAHVKGDNLYLKDSFKSEGVDFMTLVRCSPESNLIEIIINVVVQSFNSEFNSKILK